MNRIYTTAGLLSLAVALGGCSSGSGNDAASHQLLSGKTQGKVVLIQKKDDLAKISNKLWVLSSWTSTDGEVSLPADKSITFELKDGVAYGRSAVNQYRFAMGISDGGAISWKPGISTMMAGPEKNMAFEKRYMDTLPKVSSIGLDESGQLILTTPGDAMIFAPGKMFFAGDGIFN